jgi:hypothetical protein
MGGPAPECCCVLYDYAIDGTIAREMKNEKRAMKNAKRQEPSGRREALG